MGDCSLVTIKAPGGTIERERKAARREHSPRQEASPSAPGWAGAVPLLQGQNTSGESWGLQRDHKAKCGTRELVWVEKTFKNITFNC